MDIVSAVKQALEQECGMTRMSMLDAVIIPIHEKTPFYVYVEKNNGSRIPNWNPTPEELMADDWEITKV